MRSYEIENFITQQRADEIHNLLDPVHRSINSVKERDELFNKWKNQGATKIVGPEDDGKAPDQDDYFLGCFVEREDIKDIAIHFESKYNMELKGALILRLHEPSHPHAHAGDLTVLVPFEGKMEFKICNEYSDIHSKPLEGTFTPELVANYSPLNAIVFDSKRVHYSGKGGEIPRTHLVMDYVHLRN